MHLSGGQILLWILALGLLEVTHLRWIWWEYWRCRACGVVNRRCDCGRARKLMRL